ncbi:MAG: hypothetical protein LBS71_00790 [Puniceicoccales bacterium]|jgi:hypothetical protein|nr:hypothetical protein [Puniceicoccales bacterium]
MFNENKLVDLSEFANEFQLKQLKAELIKLTNGKKSDILLFVNNNDKLILPKILAHLEIYEMSKNPKLFALKYPEIFIKLELDLDKAIFFLGAWITENEKQKQTDV